jgi:predicted anti-sigma-YlaC factor YlaD
VNDKKRIGCDEVLENLREFLDEQERADLCQQIEEHLKHCHDCQVEVDTIKKTIVLYQVDRRTEVPLTVSKSLRAAISDMYDGRKS